MVLQGTGIVVKLPIKDAEDLTDGSSLPRKIASMTANTIGQDALKQTSVSTGTYCSARQEFMLNGCILDGICIPCCGGSQFHQEKNFLPARM